MSFECQYAFDLFVCEQQLLAAGNFDQDDCDDEAKSLWLSWSAYGQSRTQCRRRRHRCRRRRVESWLSYGVCRDDLLSSLRRLLQSRLACTTNDACSGGGDVVGDDDDVNDVVAPVDDINDVVVAVDDVGFVDDVKDDVVGNERSLNDVVVADEDVGVVSVSSLCVKVPEASCIRRTSSLVQDGCGRSRFDGKFHILVDSGAMIHVCPERFVDRRVLSSVGSCPLRIAGASGAKIAHHGYRGVSFCCGASVFSTVFAVADVKEAILSSLVMARHGWRTILDETSGCLVHRASRSRIPLVRERKGWYVVVDDAQAFWSTIAASKVLDEHQVLRSQLNPVVEENDEEDDDKDDNNEEEEGG